MVATNNMLVEELKKQGDNFIIAVDEYGVEYVIDSVGRACRHFDNPYEYCNALNIRRASSGCIKR